MGLSKNFAKLVDTYSGVRDWEYLIFRQESGGQACFRLLIGKQNRP